MNLQKFWIIVSGVLGFLGVALGAFGAHILKSQIKPEMMEIFNTGIFYQLIHCIVMLLIALYGNEKFFKSELLFLIGIILFFFSLYVYSITSVKFFTMITPIGGIFFLIGWISLIVISVKNK